MKTIKNPPGNVRLIFARILLPLLLLAFLPGARAQTVPALVNYQGRLANPDGSPLATANYQISFKVFDAATNGNLVWGPQIFDGQVASGHGALIPVVQGYFNVMLGPVDTNSASLANAFSAPNRFVEVTITNHPPIAPRQQILTTPFAFSAASATTANNLVSGINITNAVITSSMFSGDGSGLTNLNLTGVSAISALNNTAIGYKALMTNSTGSGNTAVGSFALQANTTGSNNTANGYMALATNTTGGNNTANGNLALMSNTTGNQNTANGYGALEFNTTGFNNTAAGMFAMQANTTGSNNVANGNGALQKNTTGNANSASGLKALFSNTNGFNNTADGCQALYNNTSGSNNTALGFQAGYNVATGGNNIDIGNMGLATDTNIIRIGDVQTQAFIAGQIIGNGSGLTNLNASQLSSGTIALSQLPGAALTNNANSVTLNGTFTGNGAGLTNLNASQLSSGTIALSQLPGAVLTNNANSVTLNGTFTGNGAGLTNLNAANLTGTAVGFYSGNVTVNSNLYLPGTTPTAGIIYSAGVTLIQSYGTGNFSAGSGAGNLTLSGTYNTAIGQSALHNITVGSRNTANGFQALFNNTADNNTAIGCQTLMSNTTGTANVAIGNSSLKSNTSGSANVADGLNALNNNSTGSNNIAIGHQAGYFVTTGNYNIEIGNTGNPSDNNTINIGTQGVQTNTLIAGIYGATAASGVPVYVTASGQLGTLTSSARFKQDIQSMSRASEVLLALQPVTFRYKSEIDPQAIPQFGLVAEDVEKVAPDLVAHDPQGRAYTVRYEAVNAMLLNEFLKEHQQVQKQKTEISDLRQRLEMLEKLVAR